MSFKTYIQLREDGPGMWRDLKTTDGQLVQPIGFLDSSKDQEAGQH